MLCRSDPDYVWKHVPVTLPQIRAMKVVLRHKITGRYYQSPDQWVRRADNALAFEDFCADREFSKLNGHFRTRTVKRLAPYLMPLLHRRATIWDAWRRSRTSDWCTEQGSKFSRN